MKLAAGTWKNKEYILGPYNHGFRFGVNAQGEFRTFDPHTKFTNLREVETVDIVEILEEPKQLGAVVYDKYRNPWVRASRGVARPWFSEDNAFWVTWNNIMQPSLTQPVREVTS